MKQNHLFMCNNNLRFFNKVDLLIETIRIARWFQMSANLYCQGQYEVINLLPDYKLLVLSYWKHLQMIYLKSYSE